MIADVCIVVEVRPGARQANQDAAGADDDFRRILDQTHASGRRVAFSQRILLAAMIEPTGALGLGQRFHRQVWLADDDRAEGTIRRYVCHHLAHPDQEILCRAMSGQSKQVGEVAMVAQSSAVEMELDLLIAVLTLAGHRRANASKLCVCD